MRVLTEMTLALPRWVQDLVPAPPCSLATVEDRMRFVIRLADRNVVQGTGGPFGAAVFDMRTKRLLSVGVNTVVESRCSAAHAEMMAIMLAQRAAQSYDLAGSGRRCELVTSVEPCAMCLGAIPWSGIRGLVCGARREDACAIGFDEGWRADDWIHQLEVRGVGVSVDVCRGESVHVLRKYGSGGGPRYNSAAADSQKPASGRQRRRRGRP